MLQVFGPCELRESANIVAVLQCSVRRMLPYSSSKQQCCGILLPLLQVGSISSVGVASAASTRSTKALPVSGIYTGVCVYFNNLCTISMFSSPLYYSKYSWMVLQVGVRGNFLRGGGGTGVLGVLTQYFYNICCGCSRNLGVQ